MAKAKQIADKQMKDEKVAAQVKGKGKSQKKRKREGWAREKDK